MSASIQISLAWLAAVLALLIVLPPAGWEGSEGLTFVVLLSAATALGYAALLFGAGLRWLLGCIEGPSAS